MERYIIILKHGIWKERTFRLRKNYRIETKLHLGRCLSEIKLRECNATANLHILLCT
jgi:hypothetical protein